MKSCFFLQSNGAKWVYGQDQLFFFLCTKITAYNYINQLLSNETIVATSVVLKITTVKPGRPWGMGN